MTQPETVLPADIFRPSQPESEAWQSLEAATTEARMKRMDLAYVIYLQEIAKGKSGWLERVCLRVGLAEGEALKKGKQVIGDSVKIFRLFRMPAEHGGLGMSREELGGYSVRKLRVFAQNKPWADGNQGRLREMLTDPTVSEEKIRESITADLGKTSKTAAKEFTKMSFVWPLQDAAMMEAMLRAAFQIREFSGNPIPEVDEDGKKLSAEYRRGVALQGVLADWLLADSGLIDDQDRPIPNAEFMPGGRYAPQTEEESGDAGADADRAA